MFLVVLFPSFFAQQGGTLFIPLTVGCSTSESEASGGISSSSASEGRARRGARRPLVFKVDEGFDVILGDPECWQPLRLYGQNQHLFDLGN